MHDDSRNIDLQLGTLTGEAAGQEPMRKLPPAQSFPYIPSRADAQSPTYYDMPLLKQPVWIWSIPAYFYVGGVAGVGAAMGAAAQIADRKGMSALIEKTRWIATGGGALSAALLIHDLGRPSRFLNMLRVFRVSSPMSMGSWILTAFSMATGAAAIVPFAPSFARPLGEAAGIAGGVLGLGLSGYTGVLISQTAVPVWQEAYRTTPVLFLASGAAAAASFLELFRLNGEESAFVERFGLAGKVLELMATVAMERDAKRIDRVGRPLKTGVSGALWQSAKVLTMTSLVLGLLPGKRRGLRLASGITGSLASLCLRFAVFHAGKASARDARATFAAQRAQPKIG